MVQRGAVEVVNFGVASDDGESDIAPSQLPNEIVIALESRFPRAELVRVELARDCDTPVYEVNAEMGGQLIDVWLTFDGNIIETKQTLAAGDLPPPVLEWIRQNFPGAVIDEAELVTEADIVSYDVRIAASSQQDYEGTLRVQDARTPVVSVRTLEEVGVGRDSVLASFRIATVGPSGPASQSDTTAGDGLPGPGPSEKPESTETAKAAVAAGDSSREQAEASRADSIDTVAQSDQSTPYQAPVGGATSASAVGNRHPNSAAVAIRVLVETLVSTSPMAWLPQVAGVVSDVLPVDVAAVEHGLQQILDEINSLAEKVAGDQAAKSAALRLAMVAGLIVSADLVILHSRRPEREPVLDSNTASTSWSWILGSASKRL